MHDCVTLKETMPVHKHKAVRTKVHAVHRVHGVDTDVHADTEVTHCLYLRL